MHEQPSNSQDNLSSARVETWTQIDDLVSLTIAGHLLILWFIQDEVQGVSK